MLVLTRKIGERIIIADRIFVKVLRTARGSVTLGIDAPQEMLILKEELYRNPQAAEASPKEQINADSQ